MVRRLSAIFSLKQGEFIQIEVDAFSSFDSITSSEFPFYREELGKMISMINIQVTMEEDHQRDGDERRKVLEGFVHLKKKLLDKGIDHSALKYFCIEVKTGSGNRFIFTMDQVLDDLKQMEKAFLNS